MRSMRASSISARCNVCICASSRAERSPATANSRRCRSAASAAFRFAWRWILAVCHIDTRATQNTTAPKNHSALDPIWPGLRTMYQAMERQAATPQISQPIPRQPPNGPSRRGAGRTCAGSGVGSVSGLTSPRSDGSRSLVDCDSPVISGLPFARASHNAGSGSAAPLRATNPWLVARAGAIPPSDGRSHKAWHVAARFYIPSLLGIVVRGVRDPAWTATLIRDCLQRCGRGSPCRRCSSQRD